MSRHLTIGYQKKLKFQLLFQLWKNKNVYINFRKPINIDIFVLRKGNINVYMCEFLYKFIFTFHFHLIEKPIIWNNQRFSNKIFLAARILMIYTYTLIHLVMF